MQLNKVESVWNADARQVRTLRDMHWVRVPERIALWVSVLVYECLQAQALPGMYVCMVEQARAFLLAAARIWNSLPVS